MPRTAAAAGPASDWTHQWHISMWPRPTVTRERERLARGPTTALRGSLPPLAVSVVPDGRSHMSVQARRLLHAPHPASLPGCVAACSSPGGSPRFLIALYGVPRHATPVRVAYRLYLQQHPPPPPPPPPPPLLPLCLLAGRASLSWALNDSRAPAAGSRWKETVALAAAAEARHRPGISPCTGLPPPARPTRSNPWRCVLAACPAASSSRSWPAWSWGSGPPAAGPGRRWAAKWWRRRLARACRIISTAMAAAPPLVVVVVRVGKLLRVRGRRSRRRRRRRARRPCRGARWRGATWRWRTPRTTTGGTRCARRTPKRPGSSCSAPSSASASSAAGRYINFSSTMKGFLGVDRGNLWIELISTYAKRRPVQVPRDLGVRRSEAELPPAAGRAQRAAAEEQRQRGHG